MAYNESEKEIIGLCIALEAINEMANNALLELRDATDSPGEVEVYFHTHTHQKLFTIRLLDFAKESGDSRLTGMPGSCLQVLHSACTTASFNRNDSIKTLTEAVSNLENWLYFTTPIKLWLPTLEIEADIEISRLNVLSISVDHFKYNLSRLTCISRDIHSILKNKGYTVPIEQIPLVLDYFREHLQKNYFTFYGTRLAELLNNVRWGIQDYLEPQFAILYKKKEPDDNPYLYEYPDEIQQEVPRHWFWRLLNNIQDRPNFKRFVGAHYLKEQNSPEWRD